MCKLLRLLTVDSVDGTKELNNLILDRIKGALQHPHLSFSTALAGSPIRHEIALLSSLLQAKDGAVCFELRVQYVLNLKYQLVEYSVELFTHIEIFNL